MRIATVFPLALVLVLVLVAPVSAALPVVVTGEVEEQWPVYDMCPGHVIMDHTIYTYRDTTHFDNDGNVVRFHSYWSGFDDFWNADNPDFVLTGNYAMHYTFDALTGEEKVTGSFFSITIPGYGKALKGSGLRNLTTDKRVGNLIDPEEWASFCALLGAN
jgi:hypothetical protein